MKVDIWSDIRCPFCYIGKHKFEAALQQFENKEDVEIIWHSFELDPNIETRTDINTVDYFVETKGISKEQAEQMLAGTKQMGLEIGLNLNLENSVVANSFKAHKIIQLAKTKELGNEIEEAFFQAHFAEQKNIDDEEVLVQVATTAGLKESEIINAISSDAFAEKVKQDQIQAQKIGVRGVPFFVFNDKYGVSGAQPTDTFLEVLEKVQHESAISQE